MFSLWRLVDELTCDGSEQDDCLPEMKMKCYLILILAETTFLSTYPKYHAEIMVWVAYHRHGHADTRASTPHFTRRFPSFPTSLCDQQSSGFAVVNVRPPSCLALAGRGFCQIWC